MLGEDAAVTTHLAPEKVAQFLEPMAYQGISQKLIERLLESFEENACDVIAGLDLA